MNALWKYKFWVGGAFCLVNRPCYWSDSPEARIGGAHRALRRTLRLCRLSRRMFPIFGEWIGTLDGFTNADVRAQVSGYLQRQGYQEGAFVRKGQLLFEIDPRPFQAGARSSRRAVGAGEGRACQCSRGAR